jgi:hypothetical protein
MLAYSAALNCLAPLTRSDLPPGTIANQEALLEDVSDFPEVTFELGARIIARIGSSRVKLALLVNDRQLLRFQDNLPPAEELGRLRERYYRQERALPSSFQEFLDVCGLTEDCMVRNDAKRAKGTLPSVTLFFSEQVLKRRFETYRKGTLASKEGFRWTSGAMGSPKLIYQPKGYAGRLCLLNTSEDGEACGCSGVMVEFLLALADRGYENLLLFIPDECRAQVHESIVATMQSIFRFDSITAVWAEAGRGQEHVRFEGFTRYSWKSSPESTSSDCI